MQDFQESDADLEYISWGTFYWMLPGAAIHALYEAETLDIIFYI